jgi:hypothetical protein
VLPTINGGKRKEINSSKGGHSSQERNSKINEEGKEETRRKEAKEKILLFASYFLFPGMASYHKNRQTYKQLYIQFIHTLPKWAAFPAHSSFQGLCSME